MSDRLERIRIEVRAFSEAVAKCRDANSTMLDIKNAYTQLYRVQKRFVHEAYKEKSLSPAEIDALSKALEGNVFIKSMMDVRAISDHVFKREGAVLYRPDKSFFEITSSSSEAALMASPRVDLPDKNGGLQHWNHVQNLIAAEPKIPGRRPISGCWIVPQDHR